MAAAVILMAWKPQSFSVLLRLREQPAQKPSLDVLQDREQIGFLQRLSGAVIAVPQINCQPGCSDSNRFMEIAPLTRWRRCFGTRKEELALVAGAFLAITVRSQLVAVTGCGE